MLIPHNESFIKTLRHIASEDFDVRKVQTILSVCVYLYSIKHINYTNLNTENNSIYF